MGVLARSLDEIPGEKDEVWLAMPDAEFFQVFYQRVYYNSLLPRLAIGVVKIAEVEDGDEIGVRHAISVWNMR